MRLYLMLRINLIFQQSDTYPQSDTKSSDNPLCVYSTREDVLDIISTSDEIQLYDSRERVTQFARHQAAHDETSSKTPPVYRVYLYQILKFLDCTGLPSGIPNNPRRPPTTIRLNDERNCL